MSGDYKEFRSRRRLQSQCSPSLVVGGIITTIGVVLLLDRFDVIQVGDVWRFWPMILVAAGLSKIVRPPGRAVGVVLVALGVVLQLSKLNIYHLRWDTLWPLILIGVGIMMVLRNLESRWTGDPATMNKATDAARLDEFAIFGGGERRFRSREFSGGQVLAIFGGFDIDLRGAAMKGAEVVIDANAVFGGIDIKVPENWNVVLRGTGIFGGYADETHHPRPEEGTNNLVVTGVAIFGGVSVKN